MAGRSSGLAGWTAIFRSRHFAPNFSRCSLLAGSEFALHGLTQEQKDFFRQYTAQVEQDAQARQALHAFEAACSQQQSSIGTPTHGGLLASSQSLSAAPQPLAQASNASQTGFASHSVPHTPLKQFDSSMAGLSALSTPTISTGSLSLGGAPGMHHAATSIDASSALHSSSPMTPRQLLASAEQMGLLGLSSSLLSVHAPPPGQGVSGSSALPPPPPPSTPNAMMGIAGGPAAAGTPGSGAGGAAAGAGGSGGPQQGQLTMAFASALAQAATERGLDPGTLVQLLQNPKLVDVLLTKAGDLQQQAQHHGAPGQQVGRATFARVKASGLAGICARQGIWVGRDLLHTSAVLLCMCGTAPTEEAKFRLRHNCTKRAALCPAGSWYVDAGPGAASASSPATATPAQAAGAAEPHVGSGAWRVATPRRSRCRRNAALSAPTTTAAAAALAGRGRRPVLRRRAAAAPSRRLFWRRQRRQRGRRLGRQHGRRPWRWRRRQRQ